MERVNSLANSVILVFSCLRCKIGRKGTRSEKGWRASEAGMKFTSQRRRSGGRVTFVGIGFTTPVFIRSLLYTCGNFLLTGGAYTRLREKKLRAMRLPTTWSGMKWNNKRDAGLAEMQAKQEKKSS